MCTYKRAFNATFVGEDRFGTIACVQCTVPCTYTVYIQFVSCDAQHPGPMVYMSVTILFSSYE